MTIESIQSEAWQRLVDGKSVDGFVYPKRSGRIDLSKFALPEPRIVDRWKTQVGEITQIESGRSVRDVEWRDVDFSESRLNFLRFYDSKIVNCCFDRSHLTNLQPCATIFRDCTFRGADLRDSGLGITTDSGPFKCRRNEYTGVDFSEADLRQTLYISAAFQKCTFKDTQLVKLNFGSSTFVDCTFEGELQEVIFWRSDLFSRPWFPPDAFPPNEMLNVDFSRAKLRNVEFRGIDLSNVRLPQDPDHIIIQDYASTLDKLIVALGRDGDRTAVILNAAFEIDRKWAAPGSPGILNKNDLAEAGEDAVERVTKLLRQFSCIVN